MAALGSGTVYAFFMYDVAEAIDLARVQDAHRAGLTVTPYTFSSRAPSRFSDVREEMRHYLADLRVDALFTDNPDRFPRDAATSR